MSSSVVGATCATTLNKAAHEHARRMHQVLWRDALACWRAPFDRNCSDEWAEIGGVFERRMRWDEGGEVVPEPAPGPRAGAVELQKAQWLSAALWRRNVAATCALAGLTFTEWLVVDALRELYQELGDAVSQNAIAAQAGLRRGNISDMVPKLEKKRLISRGPSAFGTAWRVFPTAEAERLLVLLYPHLDVISQRMSETSSARPQRP